MVNVYQVRYSPNVCLGKMMINIYQVFPKCIFGENVWHPNICQTLDYSLTFHQYMLIFSNVCQMISTFRYKKSNWNEIVYNVHQGY